MVAKRGVRAFPGTLPLVRRLRAAGIPTGLVTASHITTALLARAGVAGLFDIVVDGATADHLNLPGKPDPAMSMEEARRLGASPVRTAVVEDATAGVRAAWVGGFGLVVGIAPTGGRAALTSAGADVVLGDVGQLDLGLSKAGPGSWCTRVSTRHTSGTERH